jgi:hypothetical protein
MKRFVRNHFEHLVNRKNIAIGGVNFAPRFVDHGADVSPGLPPAPEGAKQYVGGALKRVPDMRVAIDDIIAEGDKSFATREPIVLRAASTTLDPDAACDS